MGLQERVLLAERALLYCFSFDFRTGDPYSFALKYHTTYKLLGEDDRQRYFSWLNIVAQGTTLCLQYPASLLGVVAVWYAQHLVYGEVRDQAHILLYCSITRLWCQSEKGELESPKLRNFVTFSCPQALLLIRQTHQPDSQSSVCQSTIC